MIVTKAVRKFERLFSFLKVNEGERIHKMLEMFHPDIAIFVETDGQPTTMAECYNRALLIEFRLNQIKEEKTMRHETRGRKKGSSNEIAIKPSSCKIDQGSKKKAKSSNPGG